MKRKKVKKSFPDDSIVKVLEGQLDYMGHSRIKDVKSATGRKKVKIDEKITVQKTGGQRFGMQANYHSISPIGLRRLAETHYEGDTRYGYSNWKKGLPAGETLNHSIKHIFEYLAGDRDEDHLAHAAWGLFAVMHFEECLPTMLSDLQPLVKVKDLVEKGEKK